ncbi:MAG TPA: hypothetical protein PLA68_06975, partial [Panacibacter sp.]|nr:hypothetical protein [Panacibacter sp.]
GRVMKFLDKLKDLLLPLSSSDDNAPPAENKSNTLTANLAITDTVAAALRAEGVTVPPLGAADVQLTSEDGATTIALNKPADDTAVFSADKIPFGKYDLSAILTATKTDAATNTTSEIKLIAKKNIEINGSKQEYSLELEKEAE